MFEIFSSNQKGYIEISALEIIRVNYKKVLRTIRGCLEVSVLLSEGT